MRKNYRILSLITLYAICTCLYVIFFVYRLENPPLFLILTIGSVAVLSTSTIYTVIQSKDSQAKLIKEKKYPIDLKSIRKDKIEIVEDYFDAIPSINEYVESEKSYKDMEILDKFVFTIFTKEELKKISLLELTKMDKIMFLREMLYFNPIERMQLIENMLTNKESKEEISYIPPIDIIEIEDKIRVYIRSLIEPGEKTKLMIIDTIDFVSTIKERIAILFDYAQEDFLLSSGGILLNESSQIKEYDIDDDDEIALIPLRKKGN
ncbi:MAG: ubiquitin-like protein [Promethearchaeota archaeon]